jgi:hypothetical protein
MIRLDGVADSTRLPKCLQPGRLRQVTAEEILVAKFVIDLRIDLPGIVPVNSTERQTIVDQ